MMNNHINFKRFLSLIFFIIALGCCLWSSNFSFKILSSFLCVVFIGIFFFFSSEKKSRELKLRLSASNIEKKLNDVKVFCSNGFFVLKQYERMNDVNKDTANRLRLSLLNILNDASLANNYNDIIDIEKNIQDIEPYLIKLSILSGCNVDIYKSRKDVELFNIYKIRDAIKSLGLDNSTFYYSIDEIKKSYKNLAKEYHPDIQSDKNNYMEKINNSFNYLRKIY